MKSAIEEAICIRDNQIIILNCTVIW